MQAVCSKFKHRHDYNKLLVGFSPNFSILYQMLLCILLQNGINNSRLNLGMYLIKLKIITYYF